MAGRDLDASGWSPVEQAYSAWLAAAREKAGSSPALVRNIAVLLRKNEALGLVPGRWSSDLSTEGSAKWARTTIARWETGAGTGKRQPQHPVEAPLRQALVDAVTALAPNPPMEMEWVTFREVFEAFAAERLERQHRGGADEQAYAARARAGRERNEKRHQFLAAWPSPASLIDPLALGLGSWAFDSGRGLPPYVHRTADRDLARRLAAPGITTVSGAPKSGKSRSILEVLQREHPAAITWWVNPSPTVLPLVVQAAKKAQGEEGPAFIVLDDAGLIGTDPTAGLTARRLHDLAAACTHLIVVVHDETLAAWEHQLTHRTPGEVDTHSIGASRELMDLLQHRIRYASVLNDDETAPAAETYEHADPRVKSFDLTRLAETLAGVEAERWRARAEDGREDS